MLRPKVVLCYLHTSKNLSTNSIIFYLEEKKTNNERTNKNDFHDNCVKVTSNQLIVIKKIELPRIQSFNGTPCGYEKNNTNQIQK